VCIRQFTLADYDAVYTFWRSIEAGLGLGMSDTRAEIAKKLARDPDLFLVAEDRGGIVGTVIGGFDGRRGMIYHLAVAASYRKQGLGGRLMAEVEAGLVGKGCRKCYLLVRKGNPDAIAFYSRRGWGEMSGDVSLMGKELQRTENTV
jgi:ribosomal protein S18 acetylase RimI-like enzyme